MRGRRIRSHLPAVVLAFVLACQAPNVASAQLVTPRTVPVQQSGQFDIFPSQRAGMAGVSLALDDTLLDPFVNPAKATRLRGVTVFTELGMHSVTEGGGGGNTFPVGAMASRGAWSAGGLIALQDLSSDVSNLRTGDHRAKNQYASVMLARRFRDGLSVGVSGYHSRLEALDGMGALYAGSDSIGLSGRISDVRAGIMKEWANGRSAELVLLHNRTDITHDVRFPINSWDPATRTFIAVPRFEHNDDRGRVVGAHTELTTAPRDVDSTRFGFLATVNRLTHPKIPNYRFSNLPRDPGTTYAFNAGVGVGKEVRRWALGVDVLYEPMFSHTWAEAGPGATDESGTPIPADTKTIENRFRFSNVKVAAGVSRDFAATADTSVFMGVQFGLTVYRNTYRLRQEDNLSGAVRHQRVGWTEWGPTLGLRVRARAVQVSYSMRLNCAPAACLPQGDDVAVTAPSPGVIASPDARLGLDDFGHTLVQKFSVTLPIHRW